MGSNAANRVRAISAWCCLLAALLLFAPYAQAAWSAHTAACCTGDHCPIPEHHHSKQRPAAPTRAEDCEHHAADGLSDCSMSCCEKAERMLLAATVFVLPAKVAVTPRDDFASAAAVLNVNNFVRCIEVLSPPPRS